MTGCIQVVSEGIAYGKASFLIADFEDTNKPLSEQDQVRFFRQAIEEITSELDQLIAESKTNLNQRVSEIFETHKYIVNDPMILERTFDFIEKGLSPNQAYVQAVSEILEQFKQIDNEYMLGRIVDILDATDRVKVKLKIKADVKTIQTNEPTILIIKELKPSLIYSISNNNIKGFVSETGYYHQHSSIIARTINMPGMICKDVFKQVHENDYVLIDCNLGELYINPDGDLIKSRLGG